MSALAKELSGLHFRTDAVRLRVQMVRRDQAAVRLGSATVCGVAVLCSAGRRGVGEDHAPAGGIGRSEITARCLKKVSLNHYHSPRSQTPFGNTLLETLFPLSRSPKIRNGVSGIAFPN